MTTRKFLRDELRREVTLTFKLSHRHYKDIFLPIVDSFAKKFNLREYGKKTAVFLLLLKNAFGAEKEEKIDSQWKEKEVAFVKLTREQEEKNLNMRVELESIRLQLVKNTEENAYLRDTLNSVSKLLRDRLS